MEVDYILLFTKSQYFNKPPSSLVALFALGLMRIIPIMAIAPFFGAKILNKPAKVMFSVILVFILYPKLLISSPVIHFDIRFIALCLKEAVIGTSLGIFVSMPFYVMESSGTLIDHQRGASSLMINDPYLQAQNSPLGVLFNNLAIIIFFGIDGPIIFIETLSNSFDYIRVDQFLSKDFFDRSTPYYKTVVSLLTEEMALAIQLASPSLVAIFMTDMFLGIANRLAPQVQITFLGMPLKSFLALFILWLGWFFSLSQWNIELTKWIDKMFDIARWMGTGINN
jgi:type III secretion protein SpaR/YscT/HrcT